MPKFLIIRFSSIGDIVLTTPVVRTLKNQVPDAEVHYATKNSFASLLRGNPYIDQVHVLNDSLKELCAQLRREKFDAVIDLHNNLRSFRIKREVYSKSFSFKKLNLEKWLLVNLKINRLPDQHIVDRYMATLQRYDVSYDGKGLDFFIQEEDRTAIQRLPFQSPYIALVIGAKHATKRLPQDKLVELCSKLNHPVVLLGGTEDAGLGNLITGTCGTSVFNACGLFSLGASAAILDNSAAVITHDTGLMHIAAALGKKMISVWGNTVPEFGMYPFYSDALGGKAAGRSTVAQINGLSCRPCSKIGYNTCPKKHFNCMNLQDTDTIISRLNYLLSY